jgi:hypothetical protein
MWRMTWQVSSARPYCANSTNFALALLSVHLSSSPCITSSNGLPDIAHHVIGRHSTQETRARNTWAWWILLTTASDAT